MSRAQGKSLAVPSATAALEACAGTVGRGFAASEVSGPDTLTQALTPSIMEMIGRSLIRTGELVLLVDTQAGKLRLIPAETHDVEGGPFPDEWEYRLTLGGPSRTVTYDTLGELDKLLPKGKPPKRRLTGIGRNCDLFKSMISEVFRPRWAGILGAQGWSEAWLEYVKVQNVAMFGDSFLPDSECRSIAKSCFRYWTLQYSTGRFSDIQRARNGKRWHDDYGYDFDRQAQDVRELKAWGLKQSTIGAVVRLSQGRVSQILSKGAL